MIERFVQWLSKRQRLDKLRVNETDLRTLQVLCEEGKMKQYGLEKALTKRNWSMSHSTVTSKLNRFVRDTLVLSHEERDGFTYYEISPIGLSILIYKGKVKPKKALDYFEKRPKLYYEMLAMFQPNLKDRLRKVPPFLVDQVTDDLWIFYYVRKRLGLRRETLEFLLKTQTREEYEQKPLGLKIQLLCVNRMEVEKKGVCVKQRKQCVYRPSEILSCPIIREQVLKQIKYLRNNAS